MKSIIFNNQELIKTYNSGIPIYLYGNGTYSKIIEAELSRIGVKSLANIVDDEHYSKKAEFDNRWESLNNTAVKEVIKKSDLMQFNFKFAVVLAINGKFDSFDFENCVNTFFVDGMLGDAWAEFNLSWLDNNSEDIGRVKEMLDTESLQVFNAFINRRLNFTNDTSSFSSKPIYYNDLIDLKKNHTVLDCGAYTGDNLLDFLKYNSNSTYICLEPDKKNYNEILNLIKKENLKNIITYNIGVSDKKEVVKFKSNQGLTSLITEDGDTEIIVDTIDDIINLPITIIKMDVEGQELPALIGAKNTIKKNLPILLISLYHKPSDLFTVPLYINQISNQYEFKLLQHYTDPSMGTPLTDLVLYCLPKNT
jgi:FkbM family methyltransferase